MAQGEQIHISSWPAVWPTKRPQEATSEPSESKQYDNIAANRTRAGAHCFEAKCFGVMCSGFMDKTMRETITNAHPSAAATLDSITQGASMFLDPTGAQIGDVVQGEEGIAYGELDLNLCVEPKQFHDVVGYYQRFDVFDLKVRRERLGPETAFEGTRGRGRIDEEHEQDVDDQGPGPRRQAEANVRHGVGGLRMV